MIGGGSRSTTPVSLNSRKSPTADIAVQATQKDNNRRQQNRGNNPSRERRDSGRLDNQGPRDNRVRIDFGILMGNFIVYLTNF